ncbi:MAG TPA: protein phosphatase 2C domain-containing protein [Pirellula sp.]|nr:protein phosphatase 2C domain-containing protein [Pirellula sp.]
MIGFMDCFGASDIGRQRPSNEDHFLIADICKSMRVHQTSLGLDHQSRLFGNTQGKLLIVADGMGGNESGERASQLVLDTIVDYVLNRLSWLLQKDPENEQDFIEQLKYSLRECQNVIDNESAMVPQRRKMGSTLTLAYIVWPRVFLIHVGDSRCYLLRDHRLQQLTRDHTLAQLVDENTRSSKLDSAIAAQEAKGKALSHVLWNVIGGGSEKPHPDATAFDLQIGDTLLLCTDGLSNMVTPEHICKQLDSKASSAETCGKLLNEANLNGGVDNITVVVSRFLNQIPPEELMQELERPLELPADTDEFPKMQTVKLTV